MSPKRVADELVRSARPAFDPSSPFCNAKHKLGSGRSERLRKSLKTSSLLSNIGNTKTHCERCIVQPIQIEPTSIRGIVASHRLARDSMAKGRDEDEMLMKVAVHILIERINRRHNPIECPFDPRLFVKLTDRGIPDRFFSIDLAPGNSHSPTSGELARQTRKT